MLMHINSNIIDGALQKCGHVEKRICAVYGLERKR